MKLMATELKDYNRYIHASRYARWIEDENRRETWEETVDRYINFWVERFGDTYPAADVRKAILNMDVMPSMRTLMTAGKALTKDELAGYNCSYIAVDSPRAFDEILYILMVGTGIKTASEKRRFLIDITDLACGSLIFRFHLSQ